MNVSLTVASHTKPSTGIVRRNSLMKRKRIPPENLVLERIRAVLMQQTCSLMDGLDECGPIPSPCDPPIVLPPQNSLVHNSVSEFDNEQVSSSWYLVSRSTRNYFCHPRVGSPSAAASIVAWTHRCGIARAFYTAT